MGLRGVIMNVSNDFMIGALNRVQQEEVKNNAVINQEDFLKILAAEISNPSFSDSGSGSGGSQTDYMGSILQMNMLDQVTELTSVIQNTMMMTQQQQALSLVGKEVTVAGQEAGFITGIVEKVRFSNGFASIQVNGSEYNLNDIIEVGVTNAE